MILKPCPFCGGTKLIKQSTRVNMGRITKWINCEECFAHGPMMDQEEDEKSAWNIRPREDDLQEKINRLEKENATEWYKGFCEGRDTNDN